MKLHTDILKPSDIFAALATAPGVDLQSRYEGDHWQILPVKGSRTRKRAFVIRLESDGTPDQHGAGRRRRVNYGTAHLDRFDRPFSASYADWGHVLAYLFEIDPAAHCEYYASAEDFHAKTRDAFRAPVRATA